MIFHLQKYGTVSHEHSHGGSARHRTLGVTVFLVAASLLFHLGTLLADAGPTVPEEHRGIDWTDTTSDTDVTQDHAVEIIGPITGTNLLHVLGQPVAVVADTVWINFGADRRLPLGNTVKVHGFFTGRTLTATRIEHKKGDHEKWKLTGLVTSRQIAGIIVGNQLVAVSPRTRVGDCIGPTSIPSLGQWVEVKAIPRAPFYAGDPVLASQIECKVRG